MKFDTNKYIPFFLSIIVALCVTMFVRILIPNSDITLSQSEELALPDIPFVDKDSRNIDEYFVLVTTRKIEQWEKIGSSTVMWKKWPKEAITANFIAKDKNDNALNDAGSYSSVINMYAKFPIEKGVPITMSSLSRKMEEVKKRAKNDEISAEDLAKIRASITKEITEKFQRREREALIAKEEEERKLKIASLENRIKKGEGIANVSIDQKTAPPCYFLKIGDLIDLRFNDRGRPIVFENLSVLAINGSRENTSNNFTNNILNNQNVNTLLVAGDKNVINDLLLAIQSYPNPILKLKNQEEAIIQEAKKEKLEEKNVKDTALNNEILKEIKITQNNNNSTQSKNINEPESNKDKIIDINSLFHLNTKLSDNSNEKNRILNINNFDYKKNDEQIEEDRFSKILQKNIFSDLNDQSEQSKTIVDASDNSIKILKKTTISTVNFDEDGEVIDGNNRINSTGEQTTQNQSNIYNSMPQSSSMGAGL